MGWVKSMLLLLAAGLLTTGVAAADALVVTQREVPDYKAVAATLTTRDLGEVRARIPGTIVSLNVRTIFPGLATLALAAGADDVSLRCADAGVTMARAARNRRRIMIGSISTLAGPTHAPASNLSEGLSE